MAGSSHTSSPSTGPLLLPDPPHSAPEPASCARLPAECQLVEVRGVRVASFTVSGARLICLPQVFQLFLKHLVGGLHTVYTKLKRLHILPVVCTVEQVRVLRGLGAIQPGVNRCKLITTEDFETLYRDCTNASSRPGRPPKRTLVGVANMTDSSRLLPHRLLSPALLSQTGLTAAAMAEVMKLQKVRMMMGFHGDGDQHRQHNGAESGNEETGSSEVSSLHINTLQQHSALLANRLSELPFMVAPHHLLPVGLPPASITMAMNQMSQLSSLANMAAMTQEEESPAGSPSPSDDEIPPQEPTSQSPSRASSSSSSSPSSSPPPAHTLDLDDSSMPLPLLKPANEKLPLSTPPAHRAFTPFLLAEGLSSMETLLTNIQGLLKVAVESARSQDHSNQQERKELKLELERERDARHTLQKQLSSELHTRVSIQRRLKKEKKAKRKLQEALDFESRRREHVERSIKHLETDSATPESELENRQQENCSENRKFSKPPILF